MNSPEVATLRVSNYREEPMASQVTGTAAGKGAPGKLDATRKETADKESLQHKDSIENFDGPEQFQVEKIPSKVQLIKPDNCQGGPVIAYHCEAQYALRRILIEQGKKSFRELEKAMTNDLLNHSYQVTKAIEEKFEEELIKKHGYGRGHLFSDNNCKIIFKTFLKE